MDTASMTPAFKGSKPFLCVAVDIFTRRAYAEPMEAASAAVTKRAMLSFADFPKWWTSTWVLMQKIAALRIVCPGYLVSSHIA